MQKLGLNQTLSQKLSPQQIQFIKLLQVPLAELDKRIEEELEVNPALEEGVDDGFSTSTLSNEGDDSPQASSGDEAESSSDYDEGREDSYESLRENDDIDLSDYTRDADYSGYKMQADGYADDEDRDMPIRSESSLVESLLDQLGFLPLNDKQQVIGRQLIGSIESDGYIRRELDSISNDLAFGQNVMAEVEEIEEVLRMIQQFDPPGIAARNLQECLLLQLDRKADAPRDVVDLAIRIVEDCFDEFTRKHYDRIRSKLDVRDADDLREAVNLITHLNPKPGEVSISGGTAQYIIPDFILHNNSGKLEVQLNAKNAPDLRVSPSYIDLFTAYEKSQKKSKEIKETVTFVKQKLDAARWFIDAIKQRQQTLLLTMRAILDYQYEFLLSGDESNLRPMILKDIADRIGMDISTVSRVANSKYVQTEFGTFPLKYFFSEGISTDSGEDVSNREVKHLLKQLIDGEDKLHPLSDEELEKRLKDRGYNIARRTVAKYREQLGIPVARLRKEL